MYPRQIRETAIKTYRSGLSSGEVENAYNIPSRTIRRWARIDGVARTVSEATFLSANGKMPPKEQIPDSQMEVLDGLLLSDGHIAYNGKGNAVFGGTWKHENTSQSVASALPSILMRGPKKGRQGWRVWSSKLPQLTEQHKRWYPGGKKKVPRDIILTPSVCYWWYIGDGTVDISRRRIRLCTYGFPREDVDFLAELLRKLGLHPTVREYDYTGPYIEISRDQDIWFTYIGPCHNSEYAYKWC